tara:strand:- start:131 stop:625 length:495 start_codon:yes stop_codon:yes gene_type:complete
MGRKKTRDQTLKWEKNVKFYVHTSDEIESWFTIASFVHLITGIIFYLLIQRIFPKLSNTNVLIVVNVLHIIEDYLENKSSYSLEGLFSKIAMCKNKALIDINDHDTLQNFIGDNISFFIGSLIGLKLDKTEYVQENITLSKIIRILLIFSICATMWCHYKKRKK